MGSEADHAPFKRSRQGCEDLSRHAVSSRHIGGDIKTRRGRTAAMEARDPRRRSIDRRASLDHHRGRQEASPGIELTRGR
jgi:hypothetical protein